MTTVADLKKMLESMPDDMQVYMPVDEINFLPVSDRNSDIEEILLDTDQSLRVFMLRPQHQDDLWIPKIVVNN